MVVGGDWIRYDLSSILAMHPDLEVRQTGPTRGAATLDYVLTNFESCIDNSEVCFPVESAENASDHATLNFECKLERPATFAWETHEYLKLTDEGIQGFIEKIRTVDWSEVESQDVDVMASDFHGVLDRLLGEFFVWKRVRRKSNATPWVTDGLRDMMKKGRRQV